jgi:hypothetical protein
MPFDNIPATPRYADEIAILDRMRDLLASPDRWCRGTPYTRVNREKPESVCILGALGIVEIGCAVGWGQTDAGITVQRMLERFVGGIALGSYNDTHSHADILALIDKARAEFIRAGQIEAIMDYGERSVAELVEGT